MEIILACYYSLSTIDPREDYDVVIVGGGMARAAVGCGPGMS